MRGLALGGAVLRRKRPSAAHLSNAAKAIVWGATDFVVDREFFAAATERFPAGLHEPIAARYVAIHAERGNRDANGWLFDVADTGAEGLALAASDTEICDFAERRALAVRRIVAGLGVATSEGVRARLERYTRAHGIRPPQAATLAGVVARLTSSAWWRRALRREVVRQVERHAVAMGLVHRRASIYASAEAVQRRRDQRRRIARYLDTTSATNTAGQSFTLAELASKNVSNPRVRRTELMVRMRGFEEFAQAAGHVAMFYTWTCPSRMHAVISATCQPNPKFDGTTPRDAQSYLVRAWARVRAKLDRGGAHVYGVRVAEPHHDGTPHWHLLLFMPRGVAQYVTDTLRDYASREDAAELSTDAAREARFKAIEIDAAKGSAAGYVAKYVAKNIDALGTGEDFEGEAQTADAGANVSNVDAWAATWGIRQFQQIGGPGVTIWRELRRLREAPQLPLFDGLWEAADSHTWRDFVAGMGGYAVRRRDRTLRLWRVHTDRTNAYGEPVREHVEGLRHHLAEHCRTRFEAWTVGGERVERDAGRAGPAPVFAFDVPRTRVNNCTGVDSVADFWAQVRRDHRALGIAPANERADDVREAFSTWKQGPPAW